MLSRIVRTGKFVVDVRRRLFAGRRIDRASAEWLKTEMQRMGPTYIKIGQFISSRRDLFDDNVVEALKGLQDDVDAAPREEIVQLITRRMGRRMSSVRNIEAQPMACASIGQVHRAILKDNREVAIKVRRPGVQDEFEMDIAILTSVLRVMDMLNTENISETRELLHDFRAWFSEEMDYRRELDNFRDLRKHAKNSDVALPEFYEELCQDDFIVMSFLPSTKVSAAKRAMMPEARKKLAVLLMDTFIGQLVTDGVMHGDPHEGNLGVAADGRIVLYDMGNIIRVDASTRAQLKRMIFEIVAGNLDDAVRVMRNIPLFEVRDDEKVKKLLSKYAEYMRTVDVGVIKAASFDKEMRGLPIKFSSTVFRIVRVFALLEGLCKDLDPDFSYEPIFQKYMQVVGGDADYVSYKATSDLRRLARAIVELADDPSAFAVSPFMRPGAEARDAPPMHG